MEETKQNNINFNSKNSVEKVNQWSLSNVIFDITMQDIIQNNIYLEYSNTTHSGVKMVLEFRRKSTFFLIYYFVPSILVIFLTYAGFWLDKASVPARVSIGITPILITLNLSANYNSNLTTTSEITWQIQFFWGIFAFTAFGMIEYGILNF